MGDSDMKFNLNSLCLSFLFLCLIHVSVSDQDICADKACGKGSCVAEPGSILGYNCACDGGWKQFQLGPFTFPPCVLPNCTLNYDCGNGAPPPPPPPFELPRINLTDPCNLVWCGDGSCAANGTGHSCQCNAQSSNLLNSTAFPCFNQCAIGGDCSGLGLVPHVAPPPPATANGTLLLAPPPPPNDNGTLSSPPPFLPTPPPPPLPNGSPKNTSKSPRRYALNMSWVAAIILALLTSIFS